jgi:hypothetical protein
VTDWYHSSGVWYHDGLYAFSIAAQLTQLTKQLANLASLSDLCLGVHSRNTSRGDGVSHGLPSSPYTTRLIDIQGFYINLPVGALVAALLVFTRIPAAVKPRDVTIWVAIKKRFDLIGFALLLPACVMFFLALDYAGHQFEWNSPTIIGLFCGAGVTFILFVVWEFTMGGEEAMVPYSMIRIRAVWSSCLVMLFFFGMLELASYYMPIYFQSVNNATPLLSGVYMLPSIISQLISTVVGGALGM